MARPGDRPDLRFTHDEQPALQPLAERPYRALVRPTSPGAVIAPSRRPIPAIVVERRPLGHDATLAVDDGP